MRIDAPLPPILPEGSSMSGRISSFSSSLDNRMQAAFEMPVPATAAVETETQGHEPGRLRRPLKRREDYAADRQQRRQGDQDGERSSGEAANEKFLEEAETCPEENESTGQELDVRL